MSIPLYSRASDIRTFALGQGCPMSWLISHLYDDLPDTTWFITGTAIHEAIETGILEDLTLEDMLSEAHMNYVIAMDEAKQAGREIIQSAAKNPKRTIDTMDEDIDRITRAWWKWYHPSSDVRLPFLEDYNWPPRVEFRIELDHSDWDGNHRTGPPDPSMNLVTTADAIFDGGPKGTEIVTVDWKTGSTAKAHDSQLHTYAYGLNRLGLRDPRQDYVGFFAHLDHGKEQHVWNYYGDATVAAWIRHTANQKLAMVDSEQPVINPDWFCKTCPSNRECPVKGTGSRIEIVNRLEAATLLVWPEEEDLAQT